MTEFCALSHAESGRHIAQTPVFGKCSLSVPRDGSLGHPDQLGEASLAVDQRQVAQVAAVMLNQVGGEQHRGVGSATARNTGVCRLSDDPVVADVKREAARNNVAVGGLARVSDSVSQHSVKLALAEFLGLSSNCLPGHLLCLRVGTGGQQRRPSLRDRHYLGFCCWWPVTTLQAQTI